MEIDFSTLKRNKDKVVSKLVKTKSDIITKADCAIVFPSRYLKRGLAVIESDVKVFGVYALVMEDGSYSVSNIPTFVRTRPWNISEEIYDDVEYTILHFEANSTLITNTQVVKSDGFAYDYFDEFIIKAKIPFFMTYEDMVRTSLMMRKYAGSGIGDNSATVELIVSLIAREPNDFKLEFRRALNKGAKVSHPAWVPLESVYYTFDNTLNRVLGSYSDQGITASLVDKTEEAGRIEKILRA